MSKVKNIIDKVVDAGKRVAFSIADCVKEKQNDYEKELEAKQAFIAYEDIMRYYPYYYGVQRVKVDSENITRVFPEAGKCPYIRTHCGDTINYQGIMSKESMGKTEHIYVNASKITTKDRLGNEYAIFEGFTYSPDGDIVRYGKDSGPEGEVIAFELYDKLERTFLDAEIELDNRNELEIN